MSNDVFLEKFGRSIKGVISGFDRMIFHGHLKSLAYEAGMSIYLNTRGVLLKEFKDFASYHSEQLKIKLEKVCIEQGRPFIYLPSGRDSKEKRAENIAKTEGIKGGLVCNFSVLEPCYSYKVIGNRSTQKLEVKGFESKCLHIYRYWIDPEFGLMHARIQTWFPFKIQIYCNGKRWLANQMTQANIGYIQKDNCFTGVSDFKKVESLSLKQIEFNFKKKFDQIAQEMNLIFNDLFPHDEEYYWTLSQSEWAHDILFNSTNELNVCYKDFVRHGMLVFNSPDVLRFLQQKLNQSGLINGHYKGEVISDFKQREEGIRVKHSASTNSVKFYNKSGSVLRVEVTINNPSPFKVYRANINSGEYQWQPMRKSVDDIERRAEVSERISTDYTKALALTNVTEDMLTLLEPTLKSKVLSKQNIRALDPLNKDRKILKAIADGKFIINGFRNKDIRVLLFKSQEPEQIKKDSSKISRLLKVLKTHGIIKKINKTHRYQVTVKGTKIITALNIFETSKVEDILKLAA